MKSVIQFAVSGNMFGFNETDFTISEGEVVEVFIQRFPLPSVVNQAAQLLLLVVGVGGTASNSKCIHMYIHAHRHCTHNKHFLPLCLAHTHTLT